jgi:hypothetical protein
MLKLKAVWVLFVKYKKMQRHINNVPNKQHYNSGNTYDKLYYKVSKNLTSLKLLLELEFIYIPQILLWAKPKDVEHVIIQVL